MPLLDPEEVLYPVPEFLLALPPSVVPSVQPSAAPMPLWRSPVPSPTPSSPFIEPPVRSPSPVIDMSTDQAAQATLNAVLQQLVANQGSLQQQLAYITQNLSAKESSTVSKLAPFKGGSSDVNRFLSLFKLWAQTQNKLKDEEGNLEQEKCIQSALSFMEGDAGTWATCYAKAFTMDGVLSPFSGSWDKFEKQLQTRFGSVDEAADA
ncbi:hypothetical protein V5O48_010100 [Marasmius crinis-equi]|uniref:Retrotransposon gag domain-containing protein n=1 Tax=Marasmius crinis-equi TaxID=585013 RepID=A0ABR3F9M7_9AGAR